MDFIHWLPPDMTVKILMYLEDPSDLVRVSAVSSSWRRFVIANGLCKQLCLRMFPETSSFANVMEVKSMDELVMHSRNDLMEWNCLESEHRAYSFFAHGVTSFKRRDCISKAISASSTDNYPEESIDNTLEQHDRIEQRASYWSSKGESDPEVPESLTYKLSANLCVITEIHIQPFQAYFQFGFPIYSAKAVRFRMGYCKSPVELESGIMDKSYAGKSSDTEKYGWTYLSPTFPMSQENCLQKFELPKPVLCVGGYLQIELLGRVQRQEMDGFISYVQVVGRPLSPSFDTEHLDASGKFTLKYYPEYCMIPLRSPGEESSTPSRLRSFTTRLMQRGVRGWEQMILNTLLGTGTVLGEDESDDELVA
ncbi:F-box domain [Dillenia turbinata]|uniref:F-box domain n=1 Tax=Dillenia turbinata TaxID=194707 RepID=A0AAN8VLK3_9MAGN